MLANMIESTLDMPDGSDGRVIVRVVLDIEALAQLIANRIAPDGLLDAADVADLIKCSPRYLAEQVSRCPGFPKAIRFAGPNGRRSNARWQRREIIAWIEDQKMPPKRVGRPRTNV